MKIFFKKPSSIAEASQLGGVKENTLYRWVQAWCRLGLLEVVATRPKRGRPIKLYKTTADRFFIPYTSTSASTHAELLVNMGRTFEDKFFQALVRTRQNISLDWGFAVSLEGEDVLLTRAYKNELEPFDFSHPDAPATVSVWNTEQYLTFEEAKALQDQLYCLWHSREQRPGTRRYLLQFRLTPASD